MNATRLTESTVKTGGGGPSGWTHQSLYRVEETGERLRVTIRRDFYEFQSYAKLERWDGEQWQEVVHKHGSETIVHRTHNPNGGREISVWSPVRVEMTAEAHALMDEQIGQLLEEAALVLA